MRQLLFVSLLLSILMLTGCGPIYKKTYDYQAPRTTMGNMCITQCQNNKNMCEQMCQMRNENCRARAHEEAMYQFQIYQQEQRNRGEPIKKDIRDFDNSYTCSNYCNCGSAFNACYTSCGGKVIERKECVAFCGN